MLCPNAFHNIRQARANVQQRRIPPREQIHDGLFASHFFDINPTLETVDQLVETRLCSSKFYNPVNDSHERLVVLGMISSADGQNQRAKTDIIIVVDRSGSMNHPQGISLAIEAAEGIFRLMEDDEQVGVLVFDHVVDKLQDLRPKQNIDRQILSAALRSVVPRGETNIGLALFAGIEMFQNSPNHDRNKWIMLLTDAIPTVGDGPASIRAISEQAFVDSNGRFGVTYVGIGLSFDAETATELSRVHGTNIFNILSSNDLQEMLEKEFNYLVSPVAFDLRIRLSSPDYEVSLVHGSDDDARRDGSLTEIRTLTPSSVGAEGVKGSVLVIYL
jgi:Ca-activated chloride channel family protein